MNSIKVAYVLTSVHYGGSEEVSLTFLRNVDCGRFDIHPFVLVRPWEVENVFVSRLETEGYRVHRVPVAKRARSEGRDYLRVIRCHQMIHALLKDSDYDLVHTHGYFADIVGIPAAMRLRLPRISTCHGFVSNDQTLQIYNRIDRYVLRWANKIFAVSSGIREDLVRCGIKESRLVLLSNAVSSGSCCQTRELRRRNKRSELGLLAEDFVVGYVGRLSEEKGIKYLLDAVCSMIPSDPSLKVLIIGEGPQRPELEDRSKGSCAENAITFVGFKNDIENWLPALDVFVLPSLTEGTPMALLEAMASGIPVVATAVGDVPRIVDSYNDGIVVKAGDVDGIGAAILLLRDDNAMRGRFAAQAEKKIRAQYGVEAWVRRIEDEYIRTLACEEQGGRGSNGSDA